jgi:hypothetical protein
LHMDMRDAGGEMQVLRRLVVSGAALVASQF